MVRRSQTNRSAAGGTSRNRQALIDAVLKLDANVVQLARHLHQPALFELDLTMAQVKVLLCVVLTGGGSSGAIAKALGVSLPSITPVVDRLVERDLVVRRGSPVDRRVVLVEPTAKGIELANDLRSTGRLRWERLLSFLFRRRDSGHRGRHAHRLSRSAAGGRIRR
ncbi:MAG: MarR family transcriptional regulator [Actinobacteria bacterium]|nr:MarR family transcriptional regulator [Actinomycetota bacterium]